jgi:RNA polymerase sigma-70 factor (ECF subfamily)
VSAGPIEGELRCSSVPQFPAIYGENFDFVWRALRRFGVPSAALEDATHDVFVVVHRLLPSFEGRSTVRTWLYSIARKVARDHRRVAKRHCPSDKVDSAVSDARSPEDAYGDAERAELLDRMLAELSDEKREAFVLVELEQMSVVEAAEAASVNLNTMYARLAAARREIERAIARERAREVSRGAR